MSEATPITIRIILQEYDWNGSLQEYRTLPELRMTVPGKIVTVPGFEDEFAVTPYVWGYKERSKSDPAIHVDTGLVVITHVRTGMLCTVPHRKRHWRSALEEAWLRARIAGPEYIEEAVRTLPPIDSLAEVPPELITPDKFPL